MIPKQSSTVKTITVPLEAADKNHPTKFNNTTVNSTTDNVSTNIAINQNALPLVFLCFFL